MQKEIADRRIALGTDAESAVPFEIRDVHTDDPTLEHLILSSGHRCG
jgi:hypothetical protein